jgi:lauroyl/myristoyl acyltransferase
VIGAGLRRRFLQLRLAPDGRPRPQAPFGQGPLAARLLSVVIHASTGAGSRLPAGVAHTLAAAGGTAEWALRSSKRRQLAENLAHAVGRAPADPRVRDLVRKEVVNEAHRSADLLWALGRPDALRATTEVTGREHLGRALGRGRGVILTSLHVGGWEVATAIHADIVPARTTAIVRDDWLAWAIQDMRTATGLAILYRSEPAIRAAAVLRRGEALLILGETEGEGEPRRYPVRFLDGVAEIQAGIAVLARLCGAPIVPFSVLPRGRRRWLVTIEPPIEPPARGEGRAGEVQALQELADRWSALVQANPEHWAAVYPIRWQPVNVASVATRARSVSSSLRRE